MKEFECVGEDLFYHYLDASGRCRIELVTEDGSIRISRDYPSRSAASDVRVSDDIEWIN